MLRELAVRSEMRGITKKGNAMQPYQQRVVDELAELETKLGNLQVFITSERFGDIPDAEQGRLVLQHHIMQSYALVLEQRIGAFPPD